jgi:hypothetical protein
LADSTQSIDVKLSVPVVMVAYLVDALATPLSQPPAHLGDKVLEAFSLDVDQLQLVLCVAFLVRQMVEKQEGMEMRMVEGGM